MVRPLFVFLASLVLGAALAAPAGAQTFGSQLQGSVTDVPCSGACASSLERTAGGTAATSPISGVVVRWRLRKGSDPGGTVRLRILRETSATQWKFLRSSGSSPIGSVAGTYSFEARVPISQGDHIGVDRPDGLDGVFRAATGAVSHLFTPTPSDDATVTGSERDGRELLINADVEPDADGDAYGDRTQDLCPTDPFVQGFCPQQSAPVAAPTGPDSSAPRVRLAYSRTQDIDRLAMIVRTSEAGLVGVRGSVPTTRRRLRRAAVLRLRGASRRMSRGGRARLRLRLARNSRVRVKRLLRRRGRAVARVTVTATDLAGNSRRVSRRIRLRP